MASHPVARLVLAALAVALSLDGAPRPGTVTAAAAAPAKARDLLQRMASETPDDCSVSDAPTSSRVDVSQLEDQLFEAVKALVADRLNDPSAAGTSNAASRATSALRDVEQSSAEDNKRWPEEDRFHFKVLDLPPAILVEMIYRSRAVFVLFGSYYLDKDEAADPGVRWREVDVADPDSPTSGLDLLPLHRGPSGRPRFLVRVWRSGCFGSLGEAYYGYEWNPNDGQFTSQIIKIEGAEGLDDTASTHVGRLSTAGKIIELPYCFFSPVDTWDNPTLCAADSFDLSGDSVLFNGRVYARPDLATVAKAVQYAEVHDYVALRGYCASDAVARTLVRELPPFLWADTLDTVRNAAGRERVAMVDGSVRFDLVERRGRWLVERFSIAAGDP